MKSSNTIRVIFLLVKELGISVTRQSIADELEKHPNADSLLSISELLNSWQIPNGAYNLTLEELVDLEITTPFIASSYLGEGKFITIHKITKDKIIASCEDWLKKAFTIDEFRKIYSGSILIAEKEEESGEANFNVKHTNELLNKIRIPFVIIATAVLFVLYVSLYTSYSLIPNRPIALLILIKSIGLFTTILLLIQSFDANNSLIQKLCGGDSEKNCNAILSSKAAQLNSFLSWSEIGFFYFAGTWLTLLFSNSNIISFLAVVNILSLPYTCYSIYYQWRIARQWCVLCCTIQALLWLEFLVFISFNSYRIQMPVLKDSGILIISLSVPVIVWAFVKPYLLRLKQLQPLKEQLQQFKYNKDVFYKMLNEGTKFVLPSEEDSIIIGNREASSIITMVSNPYCKHCSDAHIKIDELLKGRNDIKLQVIFITPNTKDTVTRAASHILSLNSEGDQSLLRNALNDWYKKKYKNYEAWAKHYPAKGEVGPNEKLNSQNQWGLQVDAISTPTIFLNGRRLPAFYQPEEIKYLI